MGSSLTGHRKTRMVLCLWAQFADLGTPPLMFSPAGFGKFIAEETEKWAKVIRAANIKLSSKGQQE
jgi:hypothetical protein